MWGRAPGRGIFSFSMPIYLIVGRAKLLWLMLCKAGWSVRLTPPHPPILPPASCLFGKNGKWHILKAPLLEWFHRNKYAADPAGDSLASALSKREWAAACNWDQRARAPGAGMSPGCLREHNRTHTQHTTSVGDWRRGCVWLLCPRSNTRFSKDWGNAQMMRGVWREKKDDWKWLSIR